MLIFNALLSGLVFGLGLIVSGMANPAKVLGFLDIAGLWDPSLAFVMAGAVCIGIVAFAIARRRSRSFLDAPIELPQAKTLTFRLVGGSLLFGIGWGLAGFCPGPAIVAAGSGQVKAWIFVLAMLAGMTAFILFERLAGHASRSTPLKN
ncbi:YeeE/YedE family protein [Caballeronia sp. LZ032]|uniref:YeeE/YedE family protein n=1 Tax=Caballeronia sp. LZ032 TaxID=3038565 RepID=UPI00285510D9|nr:YeeE/YedE family protein [Caballeronia sp. LZ032]MDR5880477.1 YeeE/YedE family protein [Caballeronia sp. LZ032]